jgi:hypothetical protein
MSMTNLLSSSFFLFEVVNQIHHRYFRCRSVCVRQRVTLPLRPLKFVHLRHLRLELVISERKDRKTDVLGYARLLEVAPFMERLDLHVSIRIKFFSFFLSWI